MSRNATWGALALLIVSILRLLIVSNYDPAVAVAIAEGAGIADTALGTLAPLLPLVLPLLAGACSVIGLFISYGNTLERVKPHLAATSDKASLHSQQEASQSDSRSGNDAPSVGEVTAIETPEAVDETQLMKGAPALIFASYLLALGALFVSPVASSKQDTFDELVGGWTSAAGSVLAIAIVLLIAVLLFTFVRAYALESKRGTIIRTSWTETWSIIRTDRSKTRPAVAAWLKGSVVISREALRSSFEEDQETSAPIFNWGVFCMALMLASIPMFVGYTSLRLVRDASPSLLRRPWLPAEVVHLPKRETIVGYVVEDDGEWITLVRELDRSVLKIPTSDVLDREICRLDPRPRFPLFTLATVERPHLARCPVTFRNVKAAIDAFEERDIRCFDFEKKVNFAAEVARCFAKDRAQPKHRDSLFRVRVFHNVIATHVGSRPGWYYVVGENWTVETQSKSLSNRIERTIGGKGVLVHAPDV